MLTALILPMIVDGHGAAADFATPRVGAAMIAAAVAFVTRNTLATLGAGMAALWLLQWALG
jgi:branched-subunit amino acid transport protein